ncbi:MAG: fuconate dehydratase, partial [Cyclobacteriaceae bacterium]|nr:fuconate dehydratase [Cyclobacteriaceae bacterium]
MPLQITDYTIKDVRFPTSKEKHGSDAMNPDPDYSAAYIILHTQDPNLKGHGLTFTIGRGNEICCAALEALIPLVLELNLEDITQNMGAFYRKITGDSQIRWLGPEKGVVHLAAGALINAVWDLYAKSAQKPLWRLIADMSPRELVSCIDFTYITDVLTPEEAIQMLESQVDGKKERINFLMENGYPGYTTSAGWLGYSDEKIRTLCREAVEEGWTHIKMKVGSDLNDDIRRADIIREEIGY